MGLATTDGRIIRPVDEATTAAIEFDWCSTLNEALTYRPELRQQRWEVKKKQLAVAYAKNSLLPEMNVTALYRWLGLGNKYGTGDNNPQTFPGTNSGAINDLYGGEFQEFSLGIDYRIPIGLRRELANVRNSQLKLARDIARIEDLELDAAREISEAIRALDANRRLMQIALSRWTDTEIEKKHFEEIVELGLETLDVALEAQRRKTQASTAFYAALCEYNKIIALIHRRKGTILAYNGIHFAEGAWTGKAYRDASEHARRRGASRQIDYGWTRPQVISQGSIYPCVDNNCTATPAAIPTEGHIGQPIPTGTEYYDGQPIISQPTNAIQYSNPTPTQGSTTRNKPTHQADDSKAIVPHFVQQVSHEEPISRNSNSRNAAASKKTKTIRAIPSRDENRTTGKQIPHNNAGSTPSSGSDGAVSQPMNWEQFGLTRPDTGSTKTKAAIKN